MSEKAQKILFSFSLIILILLWRDADAAKCRSQAVKHKFDVSNGYKHGQPGYIVDHICALECGGKDDIANMQYQTIAESYAKDRWERTPEGCKKTCTPENSTLTRQVFNCN